jgi:two-component system, NtrC family, response regulator
MADILIVDDDKVIRDWVAEVVTRLGHRPVSSPSLRARGLRKIQSAPFDIVFLDVEMPDGNGLDIP